MVAAYGWDRGPPSRGTVPSKSHGGGGKVRFGNSSVEGPRVGSEGSRGEGPQEDSRFDPRESSFVDAGATPDVSPLFLPTSVPCQSSVSLSPCRRLRDLCTEVGGEEGGEVDPPRSSGPYRRRDRPVTWTKGSTGYRE